MNSLSKVSKCVLSVECQELEPRHEKTYFRGFRPGPTQTRLYSHRIWLDALNFGFKM